MIDQNLNEAGSCFSSESVCGRNIQIITYFRWLIIGTVIFLLISNVSSAETLTLNSMQAVQTTAEKILKNTAAKELLVVFDIDMTVIQPSEPTIGYSAIKEYAKHYKKITQNLSAEQKDVLLTLIAQSSQKLVENVTPEIVKNFQKQGILCLGLTDRLVGKLTENESQTIQAMTHETLLSYGIDFEQGWLFKEKNAFSLELELKKLYRKNFPFYYKGILFTNGRYGPYGKASTLLAFFKYAWNYRPKFIVAVTKSKSDLEAIEKHLKKTYPKIRLIGIHYQEISDERNKKINTENFKKSWENWVKKVRAMSFSISKSDCDL